MNRHLALILSLLLAACGQQAEKASAPGEAEPEAEASRELKVTPELQKKWGVVTGPVERVEVSGTLRLPGVLVLNQARSAQISALLDGKVVSVGADLGDQVRKGQVLLTLHSPAFAQAQTALLQAASRRTIARREFDRAVALLKDEAIQPREHQRRQADFEAATTEYGMAESNLHALGWDHPQIDALLQRATKTTGDLSDFVDPYLKVRAPIDGRVITRDVMIGEHVQPEKLLYTVSDLATLWAVLDARESELPALSGIKQVRVESDVYRGRSFEGRLVNVGDVIDEKLRTVKVRVALPNPGLLLKPNMFVQGIVETGEQSRQALAVPDEAVQTIDGEPSVFVLSPDKAFVPRTVQIGERLGNRRAVLKGLDGTETVAVAGAFNLKAELLKSSFAGE